MIVTDEQLDDNETLVEDAEHGRRAERDRSGGCSAAVRSRSVLDP